MASQVTLGKPQMIRILDCLKKTTEKMSEHPQNIHSIYRQFPNVSALSPWTRHLYGTSFLALATRFGVTDYLRARAGIGALADDGDYCISVKANKNIPNCSKPNA